jgi:hypothetical protein
MFESYVPSTAFDLLFTSGVLYLYNDEMVTSFMAKARSMLVTRGLLILRDFVAQPAEIRKSAYVDDGYCYYRSPKFWKEQALQHEFMTEHIGLSKPKIGLVRKPRVLKVLRRLYLSKLLRHPILINQIVRFGSWQMHNNQVETVFIVMRAI